MLKNLRLAFVALSVGAVASTGMVAVAGASYTPNPPVPPNVTPTNFTSSTSATLPIGQSAYFSIGTALKPESALTYTFRGKTTTTYVPANGQVVFYVTALTGPSVSLNGNAPTALPWLGKFNLDLSGTTGTGGSYTGQVVLTVKKALKAPLAPARVRRVGGDAQVSVWWPAPNDGGSPITSYDVQVSTDMGDSWSDAPCSGLTRRCLLTGLTNGTRYWFQVAATNAIGTSPYSPMSAGVTPKGRPGSPTDVSVTLGSRRGTVSWNPPLADNGSRVTSYTVTANPGGNRCTYRVPSAGPPTNQCVVKDLASGVTYTFSVTAKSGQGTSLPVTSDPVTIS